MQAFVRTAAIVYCMHLSLMEARSAYSFRPPVSRREPLVCLNYAVLMHDLGDHKAAARLLAQFEDRCLKQQQNFGVEMDPAVSVQFMPLIRKIERSHHRKILLERSD